MRMPPDKNRSVAPLGRALSFMRLLWAVAHGLESTSKRMLATLGVTGPQRLVLRLVGHHGSLSAGELARTLHIDPSSLTGMLRRLEQAGLLRRKRDPADGRRAVLTLTASGKRLNARGQGTVESIVDRALGAATKGEVRSAERLLQLLAAEFDDELEA
jgi:DNA-binding MarR family transcriptional regulator